MNLQIKESKCKRVVYVELVNKEYSHAQSRQVSEFVVMPSHSTQREWSNTLDSLLFHLRLVRLLSRSTLGFFGLQTSLSKLLNDVVSLRVGVTRAQSVQSSPHKVIVFERSVRPIGQVLTGCFLRLGKSLLKLSEYLATSVFGVFPLLSLLNWDEALLLGLLVVVLLLVLILVRLVVFLFVIAIVA